MFHDFVRDFILDNLVCFGSHTTDHRHEDIAKYDWLIGEKTYGRPLIFKAGWSVFSLGGIVPGRAPRLRWATTTLSWWQISISESVAGMAEYICRDTGQHCRDVCAGNDAWIGYQAVILPGGDLVIAR